MHNYLLIAYHWTVMKICRARIRYYLWRLGLNTKGKDWQHIYNGIQRMKDFARRAEAQGNTRRTALNFVECSHIEWRSYIFELPPRRRWALKLWIERLIK